MKVPDEKMRVAIHCYLNNGISQKEIEDYWLDLLSLSRTNMKKTMVNQPKSSQQKGRKLLYGVCSVHVNSVHHMQHIYGAIQEYAGIDRPEWLDM